VAGLGIATTGIIAARKELVNHTLVHVLPEWQMDVVGRAPGVSLRTQSEGRSARFG